MTSTRKPKGKRRLLAKTRMNPRRMVMRMAKKTATRRMPRKRRRRRKRMARRRMRRMRRMVRMARMAKMKKMKKRPTIPRPVTSARLTVKRMMSRPLKSKRPMVRARRMARERRNAAVPARTQQMGKLLLHLLPSQRRSPRRLLRRLASPDAQAGIRLEYRRLTVDGRQRCVSSRTLSPSKRGKSLGVSSWW